ncbi:UNVERIFIED_CONTAM: hypothetical protein Sradi_6910400 [Sesamum radiatum]|uniref:Uncharacterized protein n=1 Tax=Sesamum radiatum TaxID=300843 RepID=A0AAW2JIC2_SESRA
MLVSGLQARKGGGIEKKDKTRGLGQARPKPPSLSCHELGKTHGALHLESPPPPPANGKKPSGLRPPEGGLISKGGCNPPSGAFFQCLQDLRPCSGSRIEESTSRRISVDAGLCKAFTPPYQLLVKGKAMAIKKSKKERLTKIFIFLLSVPMGSTVLSPEVPQRRHLGEGPH